MHKVCTRCDEDKAIDEFNYRNKSKGTHQSHCRKCSKAYLKKHYHSNTQYYRDKAKYHTRRYEKIAKTTIYEIKLGNPCVTCGESDPRVLDFDHIDPSQKSHNVANMVKSGHSVKSILDEVSKCQILCANCHRRKTARHFSYFSHEEFEKNG